nr:hypothetical protein T22B7.5 - Caenorhabditis elegans [Caenorhabditis elegans]
MSAYVIETIFVASIMLINATMVIAFRTKYKVRLTTQPHLNQKVMNDKQRQEYNLNIVAALTCVAEIIYYCYVIYVFGINTSVPTRVFYLLYDVINDLYCGISGWLLLIYSRSMKAHVTKMLRCPMFGFRRMRIMIPPEQQFASSTNIDGNKNTSNRRVPTCGTPCSSKQKKQKKAKTIIQKLPIFIVHQNVLNENNGSTVAWQFKPNEFKVSLKVLLSH